MSYEIRSLSGAEAEALSETLCALLADSVDSGASVGFLPPLPPLEAENYWQAVGQDVAAGRRILLVAEIDGEIVGTAQLEFATKPNALHRAEIQKLLVHTSQRGKGIAGALMREIEALARQHGRALIFLDTQQGDIAEKLYEKWHYQRVGVIPNYVVDKDGTFHGTVLFYKSL
jgi:acetyltransferase